MAKLNKRKDLSVRALQGIIPYDPKRKLVSLEDMDKATHALSAKGMSPSRE